MHHEALRQEYETLRPGVDFSGERSSEVLGAPSARVALQQSRLNPCERSFTMGELSGDPNYSEMKAELQALRKGLEDLETRQSALGIGAHPTARRIFPRRLITASISLAALLVAAGGLLWGQQIQALFVNNKGDVGIGTNAPNAKLDVAGKLKAAETEVLGLLTTKTLNVTQQVTADTLDVTNKAIAGKLESRGDLKANSATITTLQGPCPSPCDLRIVQPKLTIQGDVRVNGTMDAFNTTGGINGEKPRFTLTIPAGGTTWNTAVVDLKALCGDEDGCRIKLLMQHKNFENNPPVRLITADLYMVQRTANGPIKGYTRSSGANNHEASWTLNNGSAATLLNTWSDWFSISNTYYPGDWFCGGAPAKSASAPAACIQSRPYSSGQNNWRNGADSYLVGFRFNKDITATILIYDR